MLVHRPNLKSDPFGSTGMRRKHEWCPSQVAALASPDTWCWRSERLIRRAAQITSGSVAGVVKDAQGGAVPGATVELISEQRGTRLAPVVTGNTGDFSFQNVVADTYTVEVTMSGFKTFRRTGVAVSAGDRLAIGVAHD